MRTDHAREMPRLGSSGGTHVRHGVLDVPVASIAAKAARMMVERDAAVAQLAAVTSPAYAEEVWLASGRDVRQLATITRFHAEQGFDDRTRSLVRRGLTAPSPGLDLTIAIERMAANMRAVAAAFNPFPIRVMLGVEAEPVWMETRELGAAEKSAALDWLNDLLDRTYADLGLVRDPHITRGVE
ncbi:hypothetical protein DX116_09030 [Aeromicrobium endophyticum]|uniref:Uncharacterized protein n=2 Tax=Aeromicrobium endophyticum TaxID=2292704 RepID=A0A371PCM1_9ACTN|nr:hypothetical protein DX116_09030 [Aeromicrobium endophyticum]